jgi:hypothetical protein
MVREPPLISSTPALVMELPSISLNPILVVEPVSLSQRHCFQTCVARIRVAVVQIRDIVA